MIGIIMIILIVGYLPTLTITSYASDNILSKSSAVEDKTESIQKITTNTTTSDGKILSNGYLLESKKAPEFQKIEQSINTGNQNQSISIASLKGKVVFIEFWTYSCINTLRTLPHLIDWDDKYSDDGLVIVGVHTPEFEFEKNMAGGKYSIKISNAIGQVILVKQVNHAAGSSSEPIQVNTLAKGTYQMEILQPDGTKTGLSFIY